MVGMPMERGMIHLQRLELKHGSFELQSSLLNFNQYVENMGVKVGSDDWKACRNGGSRCSSLHVMAARKELSMKLMYSLFSFPHKFMMLLDS